MGDFRQHHSQQGSASWRNVSELPSRSHGALQCQDPRVGNSEEGDDPGFAVHVGASMDGVIPEMPDLEAQFDALQDTMNAEGMVGQIDLTEDMDDEELMEEGGTTQATAGKGLARALRPFRGSGSPSKVATHHLKVKAQDVKDGKEAKIKEKEREDK